MGVLSLSFTGGVIALSYGGSSSSYTLETESVTSAGVFDATGRLVRTLWSGETQSAGTHQLYWDGIDDAGEAVADTTGHTAKVVTHPAKPVWRGVVGNSSRPATYNAETQMHRGFQPMWDICFFDQSGTDTAAYVVQYNEAQPLCFTVNLEDSIQRIAYKRYIGANVWIAPVGIVTDGSYLYLAVNRGAGSSAYVTRVAIGAPGTSFPKGWDGVNLNVGDHAHGGIAVETTGDRLCASYPSENIVKVWHKGTGAWLEDIALTRPERLEMDSAGRLLAITGAEGVRQVQRVTFGETNTIETLPLSGLGDALNLALSPDGATLAVVDGAEASQQVKGYATADWSLAWTLGQAGGYRTGGPTVAPDKFDFWYYDYGGFAFAGLNYRPNGQLWVGDTGNSRVQIFDASRALVDTIAWRPGSYVACVDRNAPERVFSNYLEFELDYSGAADPANFANNWTLKRNWSAGQDRKLFSDRRKGIHRVVTLDDGSTVRTIAAVNDTPTGGDNEINSSSIAVLDATSGILFTDRELTGYEALATDGTIRSIPATRVVDGMQPLSEQPFAGFVAGVPTWGAASVVATAPASTTQDPYYHGHFVGYSGMPNWERTSDGQAIWLDGTVYDGVVKPHLGAVRSGESSWAWRASRSRRWDPISVVGSYTPQPVETYGGGYDDVRTSTQYGGNRAMSIGEIVVYGYHGEFWGPQGQQANQWLMWTLDGLFLGNFGHTTNPTLGFNFAWPGASGNAFAWQIVESGGKTYLISNDESNMAGTHVWEIDLSGYSEIPVSIGGAA